MRPAIAFTTDRGPDTDFGTLRFGNYRIALFHIDTRTVEVLGRMDHGKNINPAWAPDGRSLAFVSDRSGVSNVYLYDFADADIYQLSNVITGITGITAESPAISWAAQADRMAVLYYQNGEYDVYVVDNPRQLKKEPYRAPPGPQTFALLVRPRTDTLVAAAGAGAGAPPAADSAAALQAAPPGAQPPRAPAVPTPPAGVSIYRAPGGFRASAVPQAGDSARAPGPASNLLERGVLDTGGAPRASGRDAVSPLRRARRVRAPRHRDRAHDSQWLYTVRFDSQEIWGADADPTLKVSIEAFEPYLEHV